jgi:hypothetical protein
MNVEMHLVRAKHEWAYIVADEMTGVFLAHGSFGCFAHTWPPQHRREPLLQFLGRLDCDYFMKKTRNGKHMVFHMDETVKALKQKVIDARRQGNCQKQEARHAWNAIEDTAEDFADESGFLNALYRDPDIEAALGCDDFWEWSRHCLAPDCKGFWEVIWPEFLKKIAQVPA